ncbi:DUF2232 domain-containing protein [Tissierella sp.]|uniref:DUF2232 domain-containing protein n=1 Tax=Tissierella sp. TaxID=41274 RepID=UPI0028594462|nr:DUF2232 domain-containing protein [Tissierella sp.]MDR7857348.1 DUF2232 domain-containing protein [Tissierella sp.]
MENNDKIKKSIIESIIVIAIMAIYIVFGIHYLSLLILIIPLPFIVLGVRNGIYSNIISIISTFIIVNILLGIPSGLSLMILFAPLSIGINYCIIKRKTNMETIIASTMLFFVSFILLSFFEGSISNLDIGKQVEQIFTQYLNIQVDMLKEMGKTNHEILKTTDLLESTYKMLVVLIPSFVGIFSLGVSYINLLLSSKILRKMGYGTINTQRFSRFKLPNNIILGIGIMILTTFVFKKLEIQYHEALLSNIVFLASFVFFMQGLSVLDYLCIKVKTPLVFRIILLSMNIIFVPMGGLISFLGILDSVFDLRKIRKKKSL